MVPLEVAAGARAISWTRLLILAALASGAFLIALGPIADGDIYWHLAAGRAMASRHALLHADPFTVSAAGRAWIDVHWLFQLGAWALYRMVGFPGLAITKAALVACTAVVLALAAEQEGGPGASILCAPMLLVTLYLARHLLPLRPVIVAGLCLAIYLWVLESVRAGATRRLWLLPALQVVWVNCQGLAPLGLALVGAYVVEAGYHRLRGARSDGGTLPLRALVVTLLLCGLASFVTPYGVRAVMLPVQLLTRITPGAENVFSTAIAENIPPFLLARTAPEQINHFRWVLLALAAALVAFRPGLRLARLLLLALFLVLALMANRNVLLLYLLAPPLLAAGAGTTLLTGRRRSSIRPLRLSAAAAMVALAAVTFAREPAFAGPTPFHFPVESARRLTGATGAVFAPEHAGGFLTFHDPGLMPYLDTRLVLHTADEYAAFLAVLDDPARFDALDARYRFRYVVLTTSYPDRYLGLAAYLAKDPRWRLLYTDGAEVLLAREGQGLSLDRRDTIDAIAATLDERFSTSPELRRAARLNLARLLIVAGQARQGLYVLGALDTRPAAQLRARAQFVLGDFAAAEGLAQVLLQQDGADRASLTLLAEVALARGQPGSARDWLQRALTVDPYDPEARAALARLERTAPPSLLVR